MACEGQNRAEVQVRVFSPAVALFSPQSQAPHAMSPTNFGAGLRLPLQEGGDEGLLYPGLHPCCFHLLGHCQENGDHQMKPSLLT